jgi:hypothetical protein
LKKATTAKRRKKYNDQKENCKTNQTGTKTNRNHPKEKKAGRHNHKIALLPTGRINHFINQRI